MHEYCKLAKEALDEARRVHAEKLSAIDTLRDSAEKIARIKKADPNLRCIEVNSEEWRSFLRSHAPRLSADAKVKEIHRALCQGIAAAGPVPSVYVQAVDVLALHEAAGGSEPIDEQ